ncbi:MAG: class I SAM-dependent methyltransferase [FCB group bacterium]|jgi:SAM-dependent methyltransferase|nr:class I SAM-dependent methyltransferase [FCB group bacterium]
MQQTAAVDSSADSLVFVDQAGNHHTLVPGHRGALRPGWRRMMHNEPRPPATRESVLSELRELASRVRLGGRLLEVFGCPIEGRRVLNVGCGCGEEVLYLAGRGASSVVGADLVIPDDAVLDAESKGIWDGPAGDGSSLRCRLARAHLAELGQLERVNLADIRIVTDDIAVSAFDDGEFDLICTWRTLEHLKRPEAALREMFRLLRPGGYAYHEYNPFFGIDGGHSPATLDLPWGHVRLGEADVERYLERYRPDEKTRAMAFYRDELNRMTIGDLERMARAAGYEVLAIVPRARTEDMLELTGEIYRQARGIYPQVEINDLVCRIVRVVLRRPE